MSETTNDITRVKTNVRVVMKHDSDEHWSNAEGFIPLAGEIIVYDTSKRIKIGDGITNVINLPFASAGELTDFLGYVENGQNYPVEIDDNGKLFVNVPWIDTILDDTDTTYNAGDGLKLTGTTFEVDCGEGLIIDEINKHLEFNPAYTAIYYDPIFDDNGASVITGRTGLMTPYQVYDLARATMLLNDAVNYGLANKPLGFYKFSTTSYGFIQDVAPVTAEDIEGMELNTETSGASNASKKIFVVGAEKQDVTSKTFTNIKVYIDKDGYLYSNDKKVLNTESNIPNNRLTQLIGGDGKILSTVLPSYVDDIIEGYYMPFETTGAFIATDKTTNIPGEVGKIYVDLDTNKTYRWSGTTGDSRFIEISSGPLYLGTSSDSAFRGDYGETAYDHAIHGNECNDYELGLYKIQTENGHITQVEEVTRNDIISYGLGYTAGEGIVINDEEGLISINTGYYATKDVAGLMDSGSYRHLWSIENGANKYVLPMATASTLGGIKIGANLAIDTNGVLSGAYPIANSDRDGLMSAVYYTHLTHHTHSISYTPEATVTFTGNEVMTSTNTAGQVIMAITDPSYTSTVASECTNRCLQLTSAKLTELGVALASHAHSVTPTGTITFEGKTVQLNTTTGAVPV